MIGTAQITIRYIATAAAANAFGTELPYLACRIVRHLLRRGRGLAIAHLQVRSDDRVVAVSSRLAKTGTVWLELDVGNASLPAILVTEDEFRRAERRAHGKPSRTMRPRP